MKRQNIRFSVFDPRIRLRDWQLCTVPIQLRRTEITTIAPRDMAVGDGSRYGRKLDDSSSVIDKRYYGRSRKKRVQPAPGACAKGVKARRAVLSWSVDCMDDCEERHSHLQLPH